MHHDNAKIHNSKLVTDYLKDLKIKILKHPPYSPDLSPCDFWLFPLIKQRLREMINNSLDDVIDRFSKEVNKLISSDFNKCFDEWIRRCKEVCQKNGDYIK